MSKQLSVRPPRVLEGGNVMLRKHMFSLEMEYFCKLTKLLWAELSPGYVRLFVGCLEKHREETL